MKTEQSSEHFRQWKKAHPEFDRINNKKGQRKWRATHPGLNRQHCNSWKKAHPERDKEYNGKRQRKWYKAHPDLSKQRHKAWRGAHPEQIRAGKSRRRAKLKNAPGWNYTTAQHIKWRWEMWGNRCWMCGAKATATDHVKPLSKNGSHWPANLRPSCQPCNNSKHAHWPFIKLI
jgi:5-methylcytosine-specific restriction endonuclease McrA